MSFSYQITSNPKTHEIAIVTAARYKIALCYIQKTGSVHSVECAPIEL
jgi:hypothetical protein